MPNNQTWYGKTKCIFEFSTTKLVKPTYFGFYRRKKFFFLQASVIGATAIVTRSLRKNLEAFPGKHSIDSLQKTAILGTLHTIRKVLHCEAWSLSGGKHRWFKRIARKKRPVTRNIHNNNNSNNNNNLTDNICTKLHEITTNFGPSLSLKEQMCK